MPTRRPPPSKTRPAAIRPWLGSLVVGGIAALFVARPLIHSEATTLDGIGLPFVVAWMVLPIAWFADALIRRKLEIRWGWVDTAVVSFLALYTLSAIAGATHNAPRQAVNVLWEWLAMGVAFLLVRQAVRPGRQTRALIAVMIAVAASISAYGLYQVAVIMPQARAEFERDPDATMIANGFSPDDARLKQLFRNRLYSVEPLGTFELTNSLAGLLAPWILVASGIALSRFLNHALLFPPRFSLFRFLAAAGITVLLIGACLLLTKSRSALAAILAGAPLVAGISWLSRSSSGFDDSPIHAGVQLCRRVDQHANAVRRRRLWLAAGVVAALVILLTGSLAMVGGLDRKIATEAVKSLGYRVQYWQGAMAMIRDHPVVGVGPGGFGDYYTRYKLPEASEEIKDPHNFLLDVWSTAGTPAAIAFVLVLGICFVRAVRGGGTAPPPALSPPSARRAELEADVDESPIPILAGAAAAIPFAHVAGAAVGHAPVVEALIACAVVGSTIVALLRPWIERGRLPFGLAAAAAAALLVNLSAAGGIGFPGVAGTLWLLLALAINEAEASSSATRLWRTPGAAMFGLFAAAVAAIAAAATAYLPVTHSKALLAAARFWESGDDERPDTLLERAAAADAWADEPWQQLMGYRFEEWRRSGDRGTFARFRRAAEEYLARRPEFSAAWLMVGERYLEAWDATHDPDHAEAAVEHIRQAVALYPNHAVRRARLAAALAAAGDEPGAAVERSEALRLDRLTPHLDQKLPDELRAELERKTDGS